ncbi:MAG: transglutaminase family protein [Alphaproteobacteria bacterium]
MPTASARPALFAALCRAGGIPARVAFADVTNHLSSEKLREKMGTNYFAWHGFTEVFLDGRWVKASPTSIRRCAAASALRHSTSMGARMRCCRPMTATAALSWRYEVLHGAFHTTCRRNS